VGIEGNEGNNMKKICIVIRGITNGGVRRFLLNLLSEFDTIEKNEYNICVIHNQEELKGKFKNISDSFIPTNNIILFDFFYSLNILIK